MFNFERQIKSAAQPETKPELKPMPKPEPESKPPLPKPEPSPNPEPSPTPEDIPGSAPEEDPVSAEHKEKENRELTAEEKTLLREMTSELIRIYYARDCHEKEKGIRNKMFELLTNLSRGSSVKEVQNLFSEAENYFMQNPTSNKIEIFNYFSSVYELIVRLYDKDDNWVKEKIKEINNKKKK